MQIVHYINTQLPVKGYGGQERMAYGLGKAQAEMGHKVIYICKPGSKIPFAEVVVTPENFEDLTPYIPPNTDVVQLYETPTFKLDYPFLVRIGGNGKVGEVFHPNTVFLSASHAANHNWTEYVHNGVDVAEYALKTKKDEFLLYLAKAAWIVKNLPGAIRIANQASIPLHVCGGKAPFWSKGVVCYGTVGGTTKLKLLQNAQALLFPIIWDEPFGIVSIEALACGTPVVATPRGALPEIVDSSCGILADSFEGLVDAVSKIQYFEPEACRNRVLQKFTHIHMAEKYLSYYSKIIRDGFLREGYPTSAGRPRRIRYYKQPILHYASNLAAALYVKEYF